ncbi:MAG: hypothetical protein QM654_12215 [Dysgonamonadaceae bacterium]
MDGCIDIPTDEYALGWPDGHRANSIRPYNGQVMFLMFGGYNNDKMQIAGI